MMNDKRTYSELNEAPTAWASITGRPDATLLVTVLNDRNYARVDGVYTMRGAKLEAFLLDLGALDVYKAYVASMLDIGTEKNVLSLATWYERNQSNDDWTLPYIQIYYL